MISCFSFKRSQKFKSIRVVHLNGQVDDYDYPVSVSEVIGNSKHFVFTPAQFLSNGSKPLMNSVMLETGQLYFLLPHSTFHSGVSPVDLAPIAKKLNTMAKSKRSSCNNSGKHPNLVCPSPVRATSHGASPNNNRYSARNNVVVEQESIGSLASYGMRRSTNQSGSWKPILATIRERSFNRRSESELLQEKN